MGTVDDGQLAIGRLERSLVDLASDLRTVKLAYAALQLHALACQERLVREREVAFRAGHRWGFEASEEGWNGECQASMQHQEGDYERAQDYAVKAWLAEAPGGGR